MSQDVRDQACLTTRDLTIVIPTYREEDNIPALLAGLEAHAPGCRVIIVDDSPDELTHEASLKCGPDHPALDIHFEHRVEARRHGGLATAVAEGLLLAKDESAVVIMDADEQHPYDTIPALLAVLSSSGAGLVMASRYVPGGNASGLNGLPRHVVSRGCTWLAKCMFPRRLHGVSDPLTGCFIVRRALVDPDRLQAEGFKILLELLVTHRLPFAEVPLRFAARTAGSSKGDLKNGVKFLRQLLRLRLQPVLSLFRSSRLKAEEV